MDSGKMQPDYSGLQYAGQAHEDGLEVVQGSYSHLPKDRRPSINSPEVMTPNEHYTPNEKPAPPYYNQYDGRQGDERAHYGQQGSYFDSEAAKQETEPKQKRVCGLRRATFFWVLAAVIFIILAAVLGGVLGSVLSSSDSDSSTPSGGNRTSNSSNAAPSIDGNTGLAVTNPDGSSSQYSYFQDPQGRIVEDDHNGGSWSIQGDNVPSSAVIATDAQTGSPLAATSWTSNGVLFRQIFYLNDNGEVMTSNTTGTNAWPTSFNILTDDTAAPNTFALAVVSDTNSDALNGVRVYYASSQGYIQECGIDFGATDTPGWNMWASFTGSDKMSGVASVLSDNNNHLYLRNTSSGSMQQWTWNYVDISAWTIGVQGPRIPSGSDIAAANDGASTDHIFYESSGNGLIHALYYGQSITSPTNIATVASGSKIAARYDSSNSDNGAVVYYRDTTNSSTISYQTIDRSGDSINSGSIE